jgi:hypothetical protein
MVEDSAFVFGSHSVRFDRNKIKGKTIMIMVGNELKVSRTAVHAMQKTVEKTCKSWVEVLPRYGLTCISFLLAHR